MSAVTDDRLRRAGLTRVEYESLCDQLHREPNDLELEMFGVLWSEHCSYKTSKPLLRRLPSTGRAVVQGPGENAGAVDIGAGWACVFKVESHNHPSAIEPFQGAATGVGGILRDVIAMGARPVAILDSLRFGTLPRSRRHLDGVVQGIGAYGNCMGIPTVGGEIYFDPAYEQNPLVNAMCVGLVRIDDLQHAAASGRGNSLLLVGSTTGRDGIQGASFASFELTESSHERRPAVQIADPFLEKCLLEACMDLVRAPGVVAVQDLGAAGLTSAVAEAASRAGAGARLDVDRVPRRESGMTPAEVMLSESQERMLIVVERGMEAPVQALFDRWELHAVQIGEVTADGDLTVVDGGVEVARVPVRVLTDGVPLRHPPSRPHHEDSPLLHLERRPGETPDLVESLLTLLSGPNLCSRWPVIRQYDHMVGNATLIPPGPGDAALLRVPGTNRALAVTIDGNGRYCDLDPYLGAQIAVCEAARNILATGARPLGVTDCLNFANPERPEVFWQLQEAVAGIAAACRALDLPVVSGNVSLYNEARSEGGTLPILPTPVIGMVGVLDDLGSRLPAGLQEEGDFVILVGETGDDLGGSEYQRLILREEGGRPPSLDLSRQRSVHDFMQEAARALLLKSAHDVAEGGLLVALAEVCLWGRLGVRCSTYQADGDLGLDTQFFSETQGRFIVSSTSRAMPELQSLARRLKVDLQLLGLAGGDRIVFDNQFEVSLGRVRDAWAGGLDRASGDGGG